MQTIPLSLIGTNTYQPSTQTLWLMENIFGTPACNMPSAWSYNSVLWAFVFIVILIILLLPLYWISRYNMMYMWWYLLFVIFIIFIIIATAGGSLVNTWKSSPRCAF